MWESIWYKIPIHSIVVATGTIRKLRVIEEEKKLLDGVKMEVNFKLLSELRNNYWMIQKLGCGGFGKVYLIKNRETKELGAAKHQKWTSSDVPKLVRREVLVLRKLLNQVMIYLTKYEVMQLLNIRKHHLSCHMTIRTLPLDVPIWNFCQIKTVKLKGDMLCFANKL